MTPDERKITWPVTHHGRIFYDPPKKPPLGYVGTWSGATTITAFLGNDELGPYWVC